MYYYFRRRRLCLRSVCLSVWLSDNWKSCEQILTKFLAGVGHGPGTNEFNFGDDPDHSPDPGVRSPKSGSLDYRITSGFWWHFMESWGVAWRPTDYILVMNSITICIIIWIRESVSDHDPDLGRTATILLCWRSAEVCALWILLVRSGDTGRDCNENLSKLSMLILWHVKTRKFSKADKPAR